MLARGRSDLVAVHFPRAPSSSAATAASSTRPSVNVPPAEVAGANGAGDAFAAGFLYGVHEGWSVERTLALAHAVAAASLRAISTTDAVEPWSKCLALADTWGWRGGNAMNAAIFSFNHGPLRSRGPHSGARTQ